jgi:hypothetical protein
MIFVKMLSFHHTAIKNSQHPQSSTNPRAALQQKIKIRTFEYAA